MRRPARYAARRSHTCGSQLVTPDAPVTVAPRQDGLVVPGSLWLTRRDFSMQYSAFFHPVQDTTIDMTLTLVGVTL